MQYKSTSHNITDYLKGFAITCVLINHYINAYITVNFQGYANGIISWFFILSGYGIFHSLEKNNSFNLHKFFDYIKKRSIRIFPLYWLSLLIMAYIRHEPYPLITYLAVPLYQAPDIYWFITSLLQCYILAPIFYFTLKRIGLTAYLILMLLLMLFVYLLFPFNFDALTYSLVHFVYRSLFLGHVFLFAIGIALPQLLSKYKTRYRKSHLILFLSLFVFFISIHYTKNNTNILSLSEIDIAPLFLISALASCFFMILASPQTPFNSIVTLLGKYSYSIYLFHEIFYKSLSLMGVIKHGSLTSLLYTALLFPIYFFCCAVIENSLTAILRTRKTI